MSELQEVKEWVGSISSDAELYAQQLIELTQSFDKFVAVFCKATDGTADRSASNVKIGFLSAEKQLALAAKSLLLAAEAGNDWCGNAYVKVKTR